MGTLRTIHTKKSIHARETTTLWTGNKKHPTPASHVTSSTIGKLHDGRRDDLGPSSVSTRLAVFSNAFLQFEMGLVFTTSTKRQRLSFERGRLLSTSTVSPSLADSSSSCAWYFLVDFMLFL